MTIIVRDWSGHPFIGMDINFSASDPRLDLLNQEGVEIQTEADPDEPYDLEEQTAWLADNGINEDDYLLIHDYDVVDYDAKDVEVATYLSWWFQEKHKGIAMMFKLAFGGEQ